MKDWLGNEYDVGDKVIYAAMSGRSITMVIAEVVKIYEVPKYVGSDETVTKVTVQPLKSSRWEQHWDRTRYLDTRTGKFVDPFRAKSKHGVGGYWEHEETGEKVTDEESYLDCRFDGIRSHYSWPKPEELPTGWRHIPWKIADHIKEVKEGPGSVTLSVTKNIVKWVGFEDARLRFQMSPMW